MTAPNGCRRPCQKSVSKFPPKFVCLGRGGGLSLPVHLARECTVPSREELTTALHRSRKGVPLMNTKMTCQSMAPTTRVWGLEAHPLSRAQVLELSLATAQRAHVLVGYEGVAFGGGTSAPLAQLAVRPMAQVQGTSVPNGKQSVIGTDPVGGVRGIPPRGWPV